MLEVKTTSKTNYKLGKTTIHQKVGEDFEPDKPIMSGPAFPQKDDRITSPERDLMNTKRKSVSSSKDKIDGVKEEKKLPAQEKLVKNL